MAKDPAVLFYTSDFLTGTSFMSYEQKGQYITLLCQQHQHGTIPEDYMISVCGSLDSPVVKKFTITDNGEYFNERMEKEALKRRKFCESRGNNRSGRPASKIIRKSYDNHMSQHMENDNENINDNSKSKEEEKKFKETQAKRFELIWSKYPKPDGRKRAERSFSASVKTDQDWADIKKAYENYMAHIKNNNTEKQYIKNGSTWFNNWRDWISIIPRTAEDEQKEKEIRTLENIDRMVKENERIQETIDAARRNGHFDRY